MAGKVTTRPNARLSQHRFRCTIPNTSLENLIIVRILTCALTVLSPLMALVQDSASEPGLLYYSITGWTNSTSPSENATYAMEHREVQRLLLDMAKSPRDREYVEKALSGSGVSVSDMIANGSLRSEQGLYWLNFQPSHALQPEDHPTRSG